MDRALRGELERSRRYEHPLALVWLPLDGARAAEPLADALRTSVREVDCVVAAANGVLVLLPECDGPMAHALLARLANERPALLPEDARVVSFPADGVTEGSLLELLVAAEPAEPRGAPGVPATPVPDARAVRRFARRVLVRVRGADQARPDIGSRRTT